VSVGTGEEHRKKQMNRGMQQVDKAASTWRYAAGAVSGLVPEHHAT
jgi:hypothetical protein